MFIICEDHSKIKPDDLESILDEKPIDRKRIQRS